MAYLQIVVGNSEVLAVRDINQSSINKAQRNANDILQIDSNEFRTL